MSADKITNVVGAIGAAAAAATPVLQAAGGNTLHQGDYFQLAYAVALAVISWFTGKKQVE